MQRARTDADAVDERVADSVVLLDATGRCVKASSGAELSAGTTLANLATKIPEADASRLRDAFEKALQRGRAGVRVQLREGGGRVFATLTRLEGEPSAQGARVCLVASHGGSASPQRDMFLDAVQERIDAGDKAYAIGVIDIPDFRRIVSGLGQRGADGVLSELANRLRHALGEDAEVHRIGSSELGVLLRDVAHEEVAAGMLTVAHDELRSPVTVFGQEVTVRTALGVASGKRDYRDASGVLSDAESASLRAMVRDTSGGEVFRTAIRDEDRRLIDVAGSLRHAAAKRELHSVFQPILDLETGAVAGFEALMRWTSPQLGFVSPGEFIPVAEKLGWVRTLDEWMIENALAEFASWSAPRVSMSVNVSAKWADDPALIDFVERVLTDTGLHPAQVRVEVTETALVRNADACARVLGGIRRFGVKIAMDDFGTGYSSLRQLAEMPLDILKVDRSFVSAMEQSQRKLDIVRAVVAMGQRLGLKLVAEGIETEQQASWLREMGCEYGQGYFFDRPLPGDEARGRVPA